VAPQRVEVIQNGIDLRQWQCTDRDLRRRELGLGNPYVFAFVGRLAEVKNVPGLLRAFLRMQSLRSDLDCRLLIVGDGVDMPACREIVARHALGDRVSLLGERSDARAPLAASDAFVMNSFSEGSPRAMIEAMSLGLPCACPAVGGVPALLQGRGWLTEPEDEDDLARALAEMASDPRAAAQVGALGRAHVLAEFDARSSLARYMRLFGLSAA
jgi:glycosyltransferase involved in cell wall biosynthesis